MSCLLRINALRGGVYFGWYFGGAVAYIETMQVTLASCFVANHGRCRGGDDDRHVCVCLCYCVCACTLCLLATHEDGDDDVGGGGRSDDDDRQACVPCV